MTPNIVRASPRERRTMYRDGDTTDIIRVIMYADRDSGRWINPEGLARLKGADRRETLENIYSLMQGRLRYHADRPGHEVVRSPAYLFNTATGDCKSYSVAIGAFCRAFGIPYRYRFTSQSSRKDLHHVYVVATLPDGTDVALDAVPDSGGKYLPFGAERRYRRKIDLRPGQRVPNGIRGVSGGFGTSSLVLMLIILAWFAFAKRVK